MRVFAPLLLTLLGACCSTCGGAPTAGGPTPFVRCAAAEPPSARSFEAAGIRWTIEGRELRGEGADTARVAILRGPAPATDTIALEGTEDVALAIVLGGFGDDAATVARNVAALGVLPMLVLVVPGGRDDPEVIAEVLDESSLPRVIDASGVRLVRIAGNELVPVAGAPDGRYARFDTSCGVSADDLDDIRSAVGEANGARRVLLSWAAPAGSPTARGIEGGDAGSVAIAELAEAIGARSGFFAFPESQAGRAFGADGTALAAGASAEVVQMTVAPTAGPPPGRADGSRAPIGPTIAVLSATGISIDAP